MINGTCSGGEMEMMGHEEILGRDQNRETMKAKAWRTQKTTSNSV